MTAPANAPITIDFDNQDAAVPHNVKIFKDTIGGQVVFDGKVFPGVAARRLRRSARWPPARTRSSASSTRT